MRGGPKITAPAWLLLPAALLLTACVEEEQIAFEPAPTEALTEACTAGWSADPGWVASSTTVFTRRLPVHQDGCGVYMAELTANVNDAAVFAKLNVCNACEGWMAIRTIRKLTVDDQRSQEGTVVVAELSRLYIPIYLEDEYGGREAFNCEPSIRLPASTPSRQLLEVPIASAGSRLDPSVIHAAFLRSLDSTTLRIRRILWPYLAPPTGAEDWTYAFVPGRYCAQFTRDYQPEDDTGIYGLTEQELDLSLPEPFADLLDGL